MAPKQAPKFFVSFDDLDELEKQPEDIQNQVLESLTPAELQVYSSVAKKREQAKTLSGATIPKVAAPAAPPRPDPALANIPWPTPKPAAAPAPAPEPEPEPVMYGPELPPPEPPPPPPPTTFDYVKRSASQFVDEVAATPRKFSEKLGENLQDAAAASEGNTGEFMLRASIAPIDAAVQATVGRAVGEFQDVVGKSIVNPVSNMFGPTGKFVTRQALSWLAGQDNVDAMDEQEQLAALNALEDTWGTTGAAYTQGLVKFGGEAPLFFIRAPQAVKAVTAAATEAVSALRLPTQFVTNYPHLSAVLGRAAQVSAPVAKAATAGAIEGAAMGTGMILATDRNAKLSEAVTDSAAFGAVLGGGFGAVVQGAPAARRGFKALGVATRNGFKTLAEQADAVIANSSVVREAQALGVKEIAKPMPGEGARQVRLIEDLKRPSYVQFVQGADGPIARVVELRPSLLRESVLYHDLPISTPKQQTRVGKLMREKDIAYTGEDVIPGFMEDTHLLRRLTAGEEYVSILTNEGLMAVPANEAGGYRVEQRPVMLGVEDGAVVAKPMGEVYKDPAAPIAVDDPVVVTEARGEQTTGVVVGAGDNGTVRVETSEGTTVQVEPHQVQHIPEPPPPAPEIPPELVAWVKSNESITLSKLQAQYKLSYAQTVELMRVLEKAGVVGPPRKFKGREVLRETPASEAVTPEVKAAEPAPEPAAEVKPAEGEAVTAAPVEPVKPPPSPHELRLEGGEDVYSSNPDYKARTTFRIRDNTPEVQEALYLMYRQHAKANKSGWSHPTDIYRDTDLSRLDVANIEGRLYSKLVTLPDGSSDFIVRPTQYGRPVVTEAGNKFLADFLKSWTENSMASEAMKQASEQGLEFARSAVKNQQTGFITDDLIKELVYEQPLLVERSVNNVSEGYQHGTYLGKDLRRDNHSIIQFEDGSYRSISNNKLYTNVPGTSKGPLFQPKAPLPDRPDTLTGRALARLDAAVRMSEVGQAAVAQKLEPALSRILPAHNYVAEDLAHLMRKLDGSKYVAALDNKLDVLRGVLKKSGQKILSDFDKDIRQLALGRLSPDDMLRKYPDTWPQAREIVQPLIDRTRELDLKLNGLGYTPKRLIKERLRGKIDQYIANIYRAKYMPRGEWAKMVGDDVVDAARQFLIDEAEAAGRPTDVTLIDAKIDEILNAADPLDAFTDYVRGGGVTPKTHKHLMRRREIPEPIRRLLGPEESGTLSLAYSLAQQEALYYSLKAVDDIYRVRRPGADGFNEPLYWALRPEPERGMTVRVPSDTRKYGRLAGRYVSRQLAEYLTDHATTRDSAGQFFRAVVTARKVGQVALNPVTWFNATVGNIEASVLAGGLDFHPRSVAGMMEAVQQMRAYTKTGDVYRAPLIHEAKRYGVDTEGYLAKEYGYAMDIMTNAVKETMREGGTILHVLEKIKNSPKHALHSVGKMYNLIDRSFKLANYMSLRRKFLAEASQLGLTGEAAIDYAASKASFRIAQSFPMPYRPNKLAATFQNSNIAGLVTNPYFTTASELTRVHLSLPARLAKEPDLAVRLALFGALTGGVAALSQYYANTIGLSPEEVEYMIQSQPDYARTFRKATVVIPKLYDDPAGRKYPDGSPFKSFDVLDFTGAFDMFRLAQGDPDDSLTNRMIFNFATMPIQGGAFEPAVRRTADAMGIVKDTTRQPKTPRLDQKGGMQLLEQAFEAGYGSAGVTRFRRVRERMDPMRLMSQPLAPVLTPTQAALQTFLPTQTIGAMSPVQGTMQFDREAREAERQMEQMMMSPEYQRASPDEQKRMRDIYMAEIKRLVDKQNVSSELQKKAEQAKKSRAASSN